MAVEASADAVYITNRQGIIEYANPSFTSMTGWTREEAVGHTPQFLHSGPTSAEHYQTMWANLECGETWRGRTWNQRRGASPSGVDGMAGPAEALRYCAETTITPILGNDGATTAFVAVQRDITEREQTDEVIKRGKTFAESLVQMLVAPTFVLDANGCVSIWNRALEELTGVTAAEVLGTRKHRWAFYSTDRPTLADLVLQGKADLGRELYPHIRDLPFIPNGLNAENWCPLPCGRRVYLSISAGSVVNGDGTVAAVIETLHDLTEQKLLEQELLSARDEALSATRTKSQFLANMSHEIRTPMSGVLGMLDLLRDTPLTSQQSDLVDTAHGSAESLLEILNDILDVSKIEAGRLQLEIIDFDLRKLAEDVTAVLAKQAHKKGLELGCYVDDALPRVLRGDPTRLRQILVNLIGNAVKFTETGEVLLYVTGRSRGEEAVDLRVEIKDTGIGISEEVREKLFQPFTQADGSTSRKFGGTGLGLAICKMIVEKMNGGIGVDSVPGQGSTFWIEFVLARGDQSLAEGSSTSIDFHSLRALIVDDTATNRQILGHYLNSWGFEIGSAENGNEALMRLRTAAAEAKPYSLAILDAHLPMMDGYELARVIKADPAISHPRLLMLSSGSLPGDDVMRDGIEQVLLKPVRQSVLKDAIVKAFSCGSRQEAPPPAVSTRTRTFNGRILLAEDNKVNQKVAAGLLLRFGLTPDIVNNGREAVQKVESGRYDLLLMDCQMPEMDGYEATRHLRIRENAARTPRLPIVAMTAHAMDGDRENCLAAGMDDYLSKPVTPESLGRILEKWLTASKTEDAARVQQSSASEIELTAVQDTPLRNCISTSVLDGLRDLMGESMPELLELFLSETAVLLSELETAVNSNDTTRLYRAAHTLKSSCANVGAMALATIAKDLEATGKAGGLPEKSVLELIHHEYDRVEVALAHYYPVMRTKVNRA